VIFFRRNDLKEKKRKRSEGLECKIGIVSFKEFEGDFEVD